MTEAKSPGSKVPYQPPEGTQSELDTPAGRVRVDAGWTLLRSRERPVADVFTVSYQLDSKGPRPVTFVFNGGPGASSAYLHLGALGPKRVVFEDQGAPPPPPAQLEDNRENWLEFSDLVFIDPVGTGFSRSLEEIDRRAPGEDDKETKPIETKSPYWTVEQDLDGLCETISRWLSRHQRWMSPVFLAGESYGGFRVARLARSLQETAGVGLNGISLISPALELTLLNGSDYDSLAWADVFPSMALASAYHGRSEVPWDGAKVPELQTRFEHFAAHRLMPLLALGEAMPAEERAEILDAQSRQLGLPLAELERRMGRLSASDYARMLLKPQRRVLGMYDASLTAVDPFPDRNTFEGPDPTLWAIERVFTAGVNHLLRGVLGLSTERDYRLLNMDVNRAWRQDRSAHLLDHRLGATDDLRYAMALNPHLQVFVTHGLFDLVTPYGATKRLLGLMRTESPHRIRRREYLGGHMFYAWETSRRSFQEDGARFTRQAASPDASGD